MDGETFQVRLLGTSLTLKVDEDPKYIEELITYLEKKVSETSEAVPNGDPLRIAILSALTLTDELFKSRQRQCEDDEKTEEIARTIIERIDQSLYYK